MGEQPINIILRLGLFRSTAQAKRYDRTGDEITLEEVERIKT
jgi:hypothetical protein